MTHLVSVVKMLTLFNLSRRTLSKFCSILLSYFKLFREKAILNIKKKYTKNGALIRAIKILYKMYVCACIYLHVYMY